MTLGRRQEKTNILGNSYKYPKRGNRRRLGKKREGKKKAKKQKMKTPAMP